MLAPKGFTQQTDKKAYVAARMAAQKRVGLLRFTWAVRVLAIAMTLYGVNTLLTSGSRTSHLLWGAALILVALTMVAIWEAAVVPYMKAKATLDFETFDAIMNHAAVTFAADEMTLSTPLMTRRVEYAKTRVCIELPARFVIVADDDSVLILEKDCFSDREATQTFLRDVFARWYCRMK